MRLFNFIAENRQSLGIEIDTPNGPRAYDAATKLTTSTGESLSNLDELLQTEDWFAMVLKAVTALETNRADALVPGNYRILAPFSRPGKIVCIGKNYAAHARETGSEPPAEPVLFSKSADCIIGPDDAVCFNKSIGRVDPEIELAVVIGKDGRDIPQHEAWEYAAGYTILNDVTARDIQSGAKTSQGPWFLAKNMDTFCPMGPYFVPAAVITDPHDLTLTLTVNQTIRQQENTRMMIFSIPVLIEYISRYLTLKRGDIIATGTPHGIAPVESGDIMECRIDRLGTLRNPVA